MKYDLLRLNNNIVKSISINEKYSFTEDEMKGTDLIKLDDVTIIGELFKNSLDNIELNVDIDGIMVLPCAITLKPVNYPFTITVIGEISELLEENQINFQNSIDILPIIWENILMEIPMRVVSDEAKKSNLDIKGDGWSFVGDEQEHDSPFSELMDMIDDSEVK